MKASTNSILLLLLLCSFHLKSFSQFSSFTTQYLVGQTHVSIIEDCYKGCGKKMVFINVHDNEQTSRQAADSFLKVHGGLLVHIANDSNRNVNFTFRDKCYTFDPNRIYSRNGRLASLTLLSEQKDSLPEPEVAYFAITILRNYINNRSLVVALHNNSDTSFSIQSYVHSQDSIPHSGKSYINPEMDEDDFILTTDLSIFKYLETKKINVVWENVHLITDDGSLSVYASLYHIPYINIEAEHGHLQQQFMMLEALEDILQKLEKTGKLRSHLSLKKKNKKTTSR